MARQTTNGAGTINGITATIGIENAPPVALSERLSALLLPAKKTKTSQYEIVGDVQEKYFMREINLPMTHTFSITFSPEMFDPSKGVRMENGLLKIPLGNLCDPQIGATVETAKRNGGKVLYATTSIEQTLENILLNYFMGRFVKHEDKRVLFAHEVLQSSALSYRAKKDLVTKIVNNNALLEGKNKSMLEKHLRTVMEWRNAFAHGKIQHDTNKGCFIRYYSGGTKHLTLDDKYWDEVEKTYQECVELLKESEERLEKKQEKDQ